MKKSIYNFQIGLILLYGFIANVIIVNIATPYINNINVWVLAIGYLIVGIVGAFMVTDCDSTIGVFVGYNLICLPSGLLLAVVLKNYSVLDIKAALLATVIVTGIMMLLATFCPFIFAGLGQVLFTSLVVGLIISFFLSSTWLDWIFVIVFSLYVGYDWVMAQEDEPTFGNAVKHAANLYLDIVNLFLRLLSIKGEND